MTKRVTIRELRGAAKRRGWDDVAVRIFRSSFSDVHWWVTAEYLAHSSKCESVEVRFNSRQGAMRMALAALRAK
jgi:hypothetical protein